MVCGLCHAMHLAALTGSRFARSISHGRKPAGLTQRLSFAQLPRPDSVRSYRVSPVCRGALSRGSPFKHRVKEQSQSSAVRFRAACSSRGPFSFCCLSAFFSSLFLGRFDSNASSCFYPASRNVSSPPKRPQLSHAGLTAAEGRRPGTSAHPQPLAPCCPPFSVLLLPVASLSCPPAPGALRTHPSAGTPGPPCLRYGRVIT